MESIVKRFAVLLLGLVFAVAASAKEMKVGVIDLHKIVAESAEVNKIKKQLETKFKPRQKKLLALQATLKADMEKLTRDASVMTETQKKALQKKVMEQQAKMQALGQAYQSELGQAQNEAMKTFFDHVKKVVDEVAKADHYDLILQKEGVPFVANQMNITDKVMAKL